MSTSRAGMLLASIALVILVACTTEDQPVPSPQDWLTANADGWNDTYGFSLRLPPGWNLRELQGIDSYVGEIVGGGVRLHFDYGAYSNQLPYEGDPAYTVTWEEIGGREAKLVRPREGTEELTGVYFENFEPALFRPGSVTIDLVVYATDLTLEQQETAFTIFRSIRRLPTPTD